MDKSSVIEASDAMVIELQALARQGGLRTWRLRDRELLPVVQGGMGVGVSAASLAGTVTGFGGVGTVSSVDLRRRHADLMAATAHLDKEPDARARIDAANLVALDREIRGAQAIAQGRGLVAVNVMKALSAYEQCVQQALQSGADAVVVGAGLPLDLPELALDHPHTALIPILSDARGVEREIPLIAAGGIGSRDDILRLQALGASAVQLGTAFAVTRECDADPAFQRVLAEARPEMRPKSV